MLGPRRIIRQPRGPGPTKCWRAATWVTARGGAGRGPRGAPAALAGGRGPRDWGADLGLGGRRRPGRGIVAAGSRVASERGVGEGDLEAMGTVPSLARRGCGPVVSGF
ncbi:spidroin-1-like [Lontra canadensis]|uniref:spidroin-1-like n=1 Tax=Lontra canadensis TaxID=76717 RepID=UPI0013F2C525|nr:spidroin-1-like [Lontra canadensis]